MHPRGGVLAPDETRRRQGAIVNVASGAVRLGLPDEYVDCRAWKARLIRCRSVWRREVAVAGIRVNAVRPDL